MRTHSFLATATVALLTAGPVQAQQHDHPGDAAEPASSMHAGEGMMCMGMMGDDMGMAPLSSKLLGARDALGLTAEQVTALSGLASKFEMEHGDHMANHMQERRTAQGALADGDLEAYERHLRAAADHMVQGRIAMAEASQQARALLTTDQIDQLERAMAMMGHMKGGMSGMMQGHEPGPGH